MNGGNKIKANLTQTDQQSADQQTRKWPEMPAVVWSRERRLQQAGKRNRDWAVELAFESDRAGNVARKRRGLSLDLTPGLVAWKMYTSFLSHPLKEPRLRKVSSKHSLLSHSRFAKIELGLKGENERKKEGGEKKSEEYSK